MSRRNFKHYRRCHVCGTLNESESSQPCERCSHCKKHFADFFFYDEKKIPFVEANEPYFSVPVFDHPRPILGLSFYWDES